MDTISLDIVRSSRVLPSRLVRWWLQVPPNLSARERWYYGAALVAHPASLLGHGAFAFVFWYLGVWQMALYNVGSVAVWVAMAALLRRRKLALNFFILATETACHAVLATLFLGWNSGAQYYLILLAIAPVLAPVASWIMGAYVTVAAGTFFALYLWTGYHAPWASIGTRPLTIGQAFCVAHVFTIAALMVGYVIGIATRTEAALQDAHERSEKLLSNVLPQTIASRLKDDSTRIAEAFSDASVLFADVVGFTELCATAPPATVVDMLDALFSAFDLLVSDLGLEKIKTIGDCYMVAAGIPERRADHAEALADLALAMLKTVSYYNDEKGTALSLRIGIHSGPVIAGVIGKSRFLYDLWGDSVNTAARLETYSEPGKIQVSQAICALLRDRFAFSERGVIAMKGKGEMETYWLLGRKAPKVDALSRIVPG